MEITIIQYLIINQTQVHISYSTQSGVTESCCDDVRIYNGAGDLLAQFLGDFSGTFVSDDNGITIVFDSDGSVSKVDETIGSEILQGELSNFLDIVMRYRCTWMY